MRRILYKLFGWFKYPGYRCNACDKWVPRIFGVAEVLWTKTAVPDLQNKRIVLPSVLLRCPQCRKAKFWGNVTP